MSSSLKQQRKQQALLLTHPRPSPPGLWRCDVADALLARSRGDARAVARRADERRRGISQPSGGPSGGPSVVSFAPTSSSVAGAVSGGGDSKVAVSGGAAAAVSSAAALPSPESHVALKHSILWQQTREGFERLTRALASAENASSETVLEFLRTRRGKAEKEEVQERVRKDGVALAWQPRIRAKPPAWNRLRTVVAHLPLGGACLGSSSGGGGGDSDNASGGGGDDLNEYSHYDSSSGGGGGGSDASSSSNQVSVQGTSRFDSRSRARNLAMFKIAKRMRIDALFEARAAEVYYCIIFVQCV